MQDTVGGALSSDVGHSRKSNQAFFFGISVKRYLELLYETSAPLCYAGSKQRRTVHSTCSSIVHETMGQESSFNFGILQGLHYLVPSHVYTTCVTPNTHVYFSHRLRRRSFTEKAKAKETREPVRGGEMAPTFKPN